MPEIQSDHATLKASNTIKSLTGIRGIAALWVLAFHFQITSQNNGFESRHGFALATAGWVGVDLFFVLSGFMLAHRHARDFVTVTTKGLLSFGISRFFRVYPLNFFVLLLILVLIAIDTSVAQHYRDASPGNLSVTSFFTTAALATRWYRSQGNWNEPTWSLSVEIIGYAAFPFLMYAIGRIRSPIAAFGLAACAIAGVIAGQASVGRIGVNDMNFIGTLVRMAGYFTAGICLRQAAGCLKRPLDARIVTAGTIFALASIGLLLLVPWDMGHSFMPAALALLVFLLFFQKGPVDRALSSRPAMFLGEISFPLYLLHVMPLLAFAYHARAAGLSSVNYAGGLAILAICLMAAAWALHRWVEQPVHYFARGIGRRHKPAPGARSHGDEHQNRGVSESPPAR